MEPIFMRRVLFVFALTGMVSLAHALGQSTNSEPLAENDTIKEKFIDFSSAEASDYIIRLLQEDDLWRPAGDTMRLSLERLINHFNEPMDSVKHRLTRFEYDSLELSSTFIAQRDTIPLRWLNDTTFITDTVPLERTPFITQKTLYTNQLDSTYLIFSEKIPRFDLLIDSILHARDTITEVFIDSAFLESRGIQMYQLSDERIIPPILPPGSNKALSFSTDSSQVIITESIPAVVADDKSPFYIVPNQQMPDSLKYAVQELFRYTESRDSILVYFSDLSGLKTPFWLTTHEDELQRLWVKNQSNDSITLWIGNPTKHDITLQLEDQLHVERRRKRTAEHIPITTIRPDRSLASIKPLEEIPVYWNYNLSSSFSLNQNFFSNWSRGGESSLATMLDLKAAANYNNTEAESRWTNNGRLRYGSIVTEEHGFRTNRDELELNSQYNKVIREKIDFSSGFHFKTQIARGYNYPNDSVVISKFLNPARFTIGAGIEYEPFKETTLNFSPLSYRNTFVLDTTEIDQTSYGIDADKRSRQEMGGQLVINNTLSLWEDLEITNSIRLFSGYLDKPQNIDVDWELNIEKRISWYFRVSFNIHMMYDDDVRFPVLDSDGEPVLLPDGSEKRSPKIQLKQFLGLTFSFNF